MNTSLLETSTAACGRLRCRELGAVHACFSTFLRRHSSSALLATELGSQFLQQIWNFRVSAQINNPAGSAKMLRHEMDLKVAGVDIEWCSKVPQKTVLEKIEAESFGWVWAVSQAEGRTGVQASRPHCVGCYTGGRRSKLLLLALFISTAPERGVSQR